MYSEALERLIKSVIADGQITDKERAVLYKKAEAEGVDADEIDVYVEGLIAEQSNQSKSASQVEASKTSYDLSQVKKLNDGGVRYYCLKTAFNMTIKHNTELKIKNPYIVFYRKEYNYQDKDHVGFHIAICFNCDEIGGSDKPWGLDAENIELKTDQDTFIVKVCREYADDCYAEKYFQMIPEKSTALFCGEVDEETIQQLCTANTISLKNICLFTKKYKILGNGDEGYFDSDREKEYDVTCSSFLDFGLYAKYAYHSLVDKSAYADIDYANIESLLNRTGYSDIAETASSNGKEGSSAINTQNNYLVRLLGANKKGLSEIPDDVPCYKKYKDLESGKIIYFIDDYKRSVLDGYIITLYLRAIVEAEGQEPEYYFEVVSNVLKSHENTKNDKVEIKPPLELEDSILTILIGAKSYIIKPLTDSKELLDSLPNLSHGDEHNFFAISEELIKQLMDVNGFVAQIRGKKSGIDLKLKPIIGDSIKMPAKWKLAYNLMTYPEKREQLLQEYSDNLFSTKIKRLFDKTPKKVKIAVGIFLLLILLRIIFG
ncbi:MAG: hypothetical protein J5630_02945 [Bacteroidaceae bacterium]|nr:hypothetical protein [Bacteroidaceae bacterium]